MYYILATEDWDSEIQADPLTLTAVYVSPCLYKSPSSMKKCVDFQKKYPLSLKRVNLKKEKEKEKEVITEHVWNPQGTQQITDGKAFAKGNYTPHKKKFVGGYTGFTLSVCPSVRP